jgi:hypothetical protein
MAGASRGAPAFFAYGADPREWPALKLRLLGTPLSDFGKLRLAAELECTENTRSLVASALM